jgi:hypothetical protein
VKEQERKGKDEGVIEVKRINYMQKEGVANENQEDRQRLNTCVSVKRKYPFWREERAVFQLQTEN